MFGFLNRKPKTDPNRFVSAIMNVMNAASALSWKDLFQSIGREKSYSERGLNLSAVYCAYNLYANTIPSLPRSMYRIDVNTGDILNVVPTTSHPVSRIFSHYANDHWSSDEMLTTMVNDLLSDGNFYAIKEFNSIGQTNRIYYIHPSRVPRGNIFRSNGDDMLQTGRKAVRGELVYRILTGQTAADDHPEYMLMPKEYIVHIKGPIPDYEYNRSMGVTENARRSYSMYDASEEFGVRFYTRGISTQMFLSTDNKLAGPVKEELEALFNDNPNAPFEDILRTRILEYGLKPVHMGIPFQHLQFIETRAFSVEDIARWFMVPPGLLHSIMGTDAGSGDLEAQMVLWIQTGIGPLLSRISSQFKSEMLALPAQPQFSFEFERLFLFRTILDKFTQSLRNLFEIGAIDRKKIAQFTGMYIDPKDPANTQRYVPTNLMTVDHSLMLEKKAEISNDLLTEQTRTATLQNDNFVSPMDMHKMQLEAAEASKPDTKDSQDESPVDQNLDKRMRGTSANLLKSAMQNVLNGIQSYEARVLEQKKQSRPDDYEAAVNEFYTTKFKTVLDQLDAWDEHFKALTNHDSAEAYKQAWLTNHVMPVTEWGDTNG
jgi:phage portal protein BeeE